MKTAVILPDITAGGVSTSVSVNENVDRSLDFEEAQVFVPSHPLNIKPSGNKYLATADARQASGSFRPLPDEALVIVLEFLDAHSLCNLGATCKALYAFSRLDDLWKTLLIEGPATNTEQFQWRGSWRSTYLSLQPERLSHISCDTLFSDVLYRPFLCANTPLTPFIRSIPGKNAVARLGDISPTDFASTWSDRPFILTSPVREWPVFKTWDIAQLIHKFSDVKFRAEAVDWPLKTYVEYMNNTTDESPLYLFDREFLEKMDLTLGRNHDRAAYWIPDCFGEDLFTALGDHRPDSRWLIVGPARSGSTFHKDPNATSAWNAVLRGSKYWIMFPTTGKSPPPPGVYVSEDQSEVTSPLSIVEWLIGFHAEARETPGCVEGICNEGEVLHVPSGWWHLVVNLEASIAITQNFVPRSHLPSVLSFLKDKPDQVSGFKKDIDKPYANFRQCLERQYPELLEQADIELQQKAETRKRKWDIAIAENEGQGFSFGFVGDHDIDSEEEIP